MKPRWTQVIDETLDTGQVILSNKSLDLKKAVYSFDCYRIITRIKNKEYRIMLMTRDLEDN